MGKCKICSSDSFESLYCESCNSLFFKPYIPKWKVERNCLICDSMFLPKNANQKYCSKTCLLRSTEYEYVVNNPNFNNKSWLKLRFIVLKRDNFTCQYCGRKAPDVVLHVDHVIPRSKGGDNSMNNLVTSCKECNLGKSDILL